MTGRTTDHARAEAAFAEFRRTGSPRAMAEVFDRTAPGLLLFARRFARDAAAAEDLVQQTFLRAIEGVATFAPGSPLMPWLTAILANEARMELRRRTPDPDRVRQPDSEEPSHAAERREAAAAMHAALARLPPAYRDVVALRYLHDTRPGRIATALDLPLPTVKTRLHRGMRKLAASLPRGLALGTVVALSAGRGLPACRRTVARAAGSSTAVTWTLTGLLAMKKILPVAAGLLLLAALWLLFPAFGPATPPVAAPGTVHAGGPPVTGSEAKAPDQPEGNEKTAAVRTAVETPAPERAAREKAIEVRARWHDSGRPAAGIPFTLLIQSSEWLARGTTDDAGRLRFDLGRIEALEGRAPAGVTVSCVLPPGHPHNVALDQGDWPRVVEVELDEGRQVAGIVVDAAGAPVAGAEVWMKVDGYHAASVMARTDAAGHFRLCGLFPGFVISATQGSSASDDLTAANLDGDREVVLRLSKRAASLDVLVNGPSGQPLEGAAVHLDDRNRSANQRYFATTDGEGVARLAGIAPGKYHLEVVHASFAPAQPEISIADAEQRRETVQLGPFAELEGRVHLPNGAGVVGATVFLGYDAGSMLQRTAQTDRNGKFHLARLAVGQHLLWITHAVPDFRRIVELHAGQQELDITVPGSRRIAGQIVDPDGRPLAGWNVAARPTSEFSRTRVTTRADGRFAFDGVTESPYLLDVADGHRTVTTFTDVRTDGEEAVYRLPATAFPKAFVLGRVDGSTGCLLVISRRVAINEDGDEVLAVPADGRFEFGPYPRVEHDVGIQRSNGNRIWWFTTADLATTDRFDLGTIRMPEPGTLEVTVRDRLGCEKLWVGVRVLATGGSCVQGLGQVDREHWRATDLPPGGYDVFLSGGGTAPVYERIAIESSRTTSVTLETAAGGVLAYRLAPPAGTPEEAVGQQRVTIRNADGVVVASYRMMGALAHLERLLEGTYTFEVATGGGFRGNATVAVPKENGAELLIPLAR